ncbi:MAG: hypothetical protein ACR2MG_04155 [Pyrinomonadaceae bacterium]
MSLTLEFEKEISFNLNETGIEVPVWLYLGDNAVSFNAKVDTGASFCIFERIHGEMLGLTIENGTPQNFGTNTGSFLAFGHNVLISVAEIQFSSTVFFYAQDEFRRNVLGRTGWLNKLKIGIIDYDGKFYLSHYDDFS